MTWKIGTSIILATSVQYRVDRLSAGAVGDVGRLCGARAAGGGAVPLPAGVLLQLREVEGKDAHGKVGARHVSNRDVTRDVILSGGM